LYWAKCAKYGRTQLANKELEGITTNLEEDEDETELVNYTHTENQSPECYKRIR